MCTQWRRPGLAAILGAVALSVAGPSAAVTPSRDAPQRIVSLNLCTDQILLQLVGRERIVALSFLSQDPFSSVLHEQAQGLPVAYGSAEEVLTLEPDLVLVGTYTTRHTTALLRRFGIPVVAVPGAQSFAEVKEEIRTVARAVGEVGRGEVIIARFEARLAQMQAGHGATRPVATQYRSGGAALGAVLALYTGLANAFYLALPLAGFAGTALATAFVFMLAGRHTGTTTLILAGVAVSSLCGALISLVLNWSHLT